ncbi:hypothetical protein A8E81_10160 [Burkholderia cenocepacia]|nr:hypothetical protein A8E75_05130 [Burkholderia cenocepacia]ONV18218.1 hypothetical protein A8E74_23425 [Burkholderia cenocepacia]ONV29192.1 hypothetical protein A8E78_20445 [Burkholderia cenocepacia]ONV31265.1 hypothetical protein A8E82_36185 [Burkholderia cenocepacia]ONV37617.1 hypothetical protein A8E77_08610 [Burkholderia cenocepacia]
MHSKLKCVHEDLPQHASACPAGAATVRDPAGAPMRWSDASPRSGGRHARLARDAANHDAPQ